MESQQVSVMDNATLTKTVMNLQRFASAVTKENARLNLKIQELEMQLKFALAAAVSNNGVFSDDKRMVAYDYLNKCLSADKAKESSNTARSK